MLQIKSISLFAAALFVSSHAIALDFIITCEGPKGVSKRNTFGTVSELNTNDNYDSPWTYVYSDEDLNVLLADMKGEAKNYSGSGLVQRAKGNWDKEMVLANEAGLVRSFAQYGHQWWINTIDLMEGKLYAVRSTGNPSSMGLGRSITTGFYWSECQVERIE